MSISRRGLLFGSLALLAGCSTTGRNDRTNYAARPDETHPMPAMKLDKIKPEFRRTEVAYETKYKPGTIVVDTPARRLYYVLGDGKAIRYAISVGREGRERDRPFDDRADEGDFRGLIGFVQHFERFQAAIRVDPELHGGRFDPLAARIIPDEGGAAIQALEQAFDVHRQAERIGRRGVRPQFQAGGAGFVLTRHFLRLFPCHRH